MNARFKHADIINLKDFLRDLEVMPVSEVKKRYGVSSATIRRYINKYHIKVKKVYGQFSEKVNRKRLGQGYVSDMSDLPEYDARPKNNTPLVCFWCYR